MIIGGFFFGAVSSSLLGMFSFSPNDLGRIGHITFCTDDYDQKPESGIKKDGEIILRPFWII